MTIGQDCVRRRSRGALARRSLPVVVAAVALVATPVVAAAGPRGVPVARGDLALVRAGAPRPARAAAPAPRAVAGLPTPCPAATREAASYPGAATLDNVGAHYGVRSLLAAGDEGAGVTIAAFELAPSSARDIAVYDRCFGLDPSNVSVRKVDSGGTPGGGTMEADVDVEQLQTQAPLAHVVVYEGPNSRVGFYDTLAAIVDSDTAQVVSIGWGICEGLDVTAIPRLHALFEKAARQGQTVLVAAGDTGSEGCLGETGSTSLSVEYPASDPAVTAVGGTVMRPGRADAVWNTCAAATSIACASSLATAASGATGGGVSSIFRTEPSYQLPAGRFAGRAVPDLSADAGPAVAFAQGAWVVGVGTSLSAPLVAGLVADVTPTYETPIGDLAPKLYALRRDEGYGPALAPVTAGNNDFSDSYGHVDYRAGPLPGYNRATGLGVPVAAGFVGPQVLALSSTSGTAGETIAIEGQHLLGTSVRFGGTPVPVVSASPTTLHVVVPPGTGTTSVVVSNPIGAAGPVTFAYTSPSFTSAPVATGTVGEPFSFTVTTTGLSAATLGEEGALPAGLSFVDNGDGTATIAGTPAPSTEGTYSVVLTASGGPGTPVVQQLTLVIAPAPQPGASTPPAS